MLFTNIVIEKYFSDSAGLDGTAVFRFGVVLTLICVSSISVRHVVSVAASNVVVLKGSTISLDGAMNEFHSAIGLCTKHRFVTWRRYN